MSTTFAKVNALGKVENIIVATQAYIDTLPDAVNYVQTFQDANGDPAKGYNYASMGGTFDAANKAFCAKQPFSSWSLDAKFQWQAPVPMPEARAGVLYRWDEASTAWAEWTPPAVPATE